MLSKTMHKKKFLVFDIKVMLLKIYNGLGAFRLIDYIFVKAIAILVYNLLFVIALRGYVHLEILKKCVFYFSQIRKV